MVQNNRPINTKAGSNTRLPGSQCTESKIMQCKKKISKTYLSLQPEVLESQYCQNHWLPEKKKKCTCTAKAVNV